MPAGGRVGVGSRYVHEHGCPQGGGEWRVGVGSRYVHEHGCPQGGGGGE